MASAENIVSLYMAAADADPEEAKLIIKELSRRAHPILFPPIDQKEFKQENLNYLTSFEY